MSSKTKWTFASFDVIRYYFSPEIQEIKQEVKMIEEKNKLYFFSIFDYHSVAMHPAFRQISFRLFNKVRNMWVLGSLFGLTLHPSAFIAPILLSV